MHINYTVKYKYYTCSFCIKRVTRSSHLNVIPLSDEGIELRPGRGDEP